MRKILRAYYTRYYNAIIICIVVIYLYSCRSIGESEESLIECNYTLTTAHTVDLYNFTPPVSLITNIINDSIGNLFFTQYRDPVIGMLNSEGNFIRWIGRYGSGPGEFSSSYITLDNNDSLIVHDFILSRISTYHPSDFDHPFKMINHSKFDSEVILTASTEDSYIFQTFPIHRRDISQDSVFIIKKNKITTVIDTILVTIGPELMVQKNDNFIHILHLADRRNIFFTFDYQTITLFQNDISSINIFDYDGFFIKDIDFNLPEVVNYKKLIERQINISGGFSGRDLESITKLFSNYDDRNRTYARYFEAIKIDDSYLFKLISETDTSYWYHFKLNDNDMEMNVLCHENPTLSIKGYNGKYFYGLAFMNDYEQHLFFLEPPKF